MLVDNRPTDGMYVIVLHLYATCRGPFSSYEAALHWAHQCLHPIGWKCGYPGDRWSYSIMKVTEPV